MCFGLELFRTDHSEVHRVLRDGRRPADLGEKVGRSLGADDGDGPRDGLNAGSGSALRRDGGLPTTATTSGRRADVAM